MDACLNEVVRYLAAQSWQIALLTTAVAAAAFVLQHRSAHVRYLLWLMVVAKCLVPPLHALPLRVLPPPTLGGTHSASPQPGWSIPRSLMPSSASRDTSSPPVQEVTPSMPARQTRVRHLSVSGWLGVAWMAGAGAYLLMNLLRAVRGHYWLRKTRRPLPEDVQAESANFLRVYGVRRRPSIWIVEGVGQPFVWGLLRGSIYIPPSFLSIESPEHRRDILAHELSHVVRLDAAVNTLQVIVQALFWFHPFVWWANRKIRQEREKCCDEMVIAHLSTGPKDYSTAIVSTLIRAQESVRPLPSLAVASPVRNIEERITTILKPGRRFYKHPSLLASVTVGLVALVTVPTALALTARAGTQSKADKTNVGATPGSHALPEGWSLDYDNGLRPDGGRTWPAQMAKDLSSLEIIPAGLGPSDTSWKEEKYDFDIHPLEGEKLGTIHIRFDLPRSQAGQMTLRPGKYLLRYTRGFGKPGDNFRMHSGPFAVDLPEPGMYKLRFTPRLGNAEITGSPGGCYAVNFERVDDDFPITGFVYQDPSRQYMMNGLPAGTYRLSAVIQRDEDNVFVRQAQATVQADEKLTVDMTPPPQGDCSLQGVILGKRGTYRIPGPRQSLSDARWFVLIRKQGSSPVKQTDAYEALTMDSYYVVRGDRIVQESEDRATYAISGIAPGAYTVTAIEHPWFEGLPIERQQSKPLTLRAKEKAVLDFDLRDPATSQEALTTEGSQIVSEQVKSPPARTGQPDASQRKVAGRVLAAETQQPVGGARVRAAVPAVDMRGTRVPARQITQDNGTTSHIYETKTDTNGWFEMLVPAGEGDDMLSLDAMAPGYGSAAGTFHSGDGNPHLAQISLRGSSASVPSNLTILLPRAIYVAGVVKDYRGRPLAGVRVHGQTIFDRATWGIASMETDGQGRFEIFDFPPQQRPGERAELVFACPIAVPVTLSGLYDLSPEKRASLEVTLPRGCKVTGLVVDADGRPAPGALVEAVDGVPFRDTTSESNGHFELAGLRPGPVHLRAHALDIDQKVVQPLNLTDRDQNVTLRLKRIELKSPLQPVMLWGMQLVDVTPELKEVYDVVVADTGVLILDPGPNHLRLDLGRLQKGYCFWIIGEQRISNIHEMVTELLRQQTEPGTNGQEAAETPRAIRVVYTVRNGTNSQYLKLTPADVTELKQLAEKLGV